jgi:hypothetical protein
MEAAQGTRGEESPGAPYSPGLYLRPFAARHGQCLAWHLPSGAAGEALESRALLSS